MFIHLLYQNVNFAAIICEKRKKNILLDKFPPIFRLIWAPLDNIKSLEEHKRADPFRKTKFNLRTHQNKQSFFKLSDCIIIFIYDLDYYG